MTTQRNSPGNRWIHARHVDYLDEKLVNLASGVYRDQGYFGIIVEEPPRHGKSELCSHYFPSWYLGAKPDNRVILVSYEETFAATWGRKVRDTTEEWGPELYGINVDPRNRSAGSWNIQGHRGGMYTAGALGSVTGRGSDVFVVDDPIKNYVEAQSPTLRDRTWNNWKQTLRTRAEPGCVALVIGTRWHEDDLIGRLLQEMHDDPIADQWIVVRLPALAEEPDEDYPEPDLLGRKVGEALFPERWPTELLQPYMSNIVTWNALYQQRPSPMEGTMFKEEWFEIVSMPAGKFKRVYRFFDTAASDPDEFEDPDWTVGLLLGEHEDGLYYVLDVARFRKEAGKVEKELRKIISRDRLGTRFRMAQEPGSQGKLYIRAVARTVFRGRPFRGVKETGTKMLRAETAADAAERGEIKLIRGAWNREFLREVKRFPLGAHDDQVDALSGAYQEMTKRGRQMTTW